MSEFNSYRQLKKQIKQKNEETYREGSKKRLIKNLEKKFKTTMIGALAAFENNFGALWGHGQEELTDDQKQFRKIWEETRTEILNNGNSQLRIAQEEIAQYTMTWNRYHVDFVIKPDNQKDNQEN
jgi:hypothetical protein